MNPMRRQSMISAVAALLTASPAAHAMKPDYSAVHNRDAARALAAQGELVPVLLFPTELGGQDVDADRVYVTPEAAQARALAVESLVRVVQPGAVEMDVVPASKGSSLIPPAIQMKA